MIDQETLDLRREYVEAEVEQSGLTGMRAKLAVDAAMSGVDMESDDDFEMMVAACLEGASEAESPDIAIPVSALRVCGYCGLLGDRCVCDDESL